MPVESVSRILEHTKITTTQIYARVTTGKLEHDISAFGEKLEAGLVSANVQHMLHLLHILDLLQSVYRTIHNGRYII